MSDGLQRYLEVASGLTRTTLGVTERAVAQFVREGEAAAEHAERLLDEVVARSVEGSGALAKLVRTEVARALERAGVARADEVGELRRQVDELTMRLAAAEGPQAPDVATPDADALDVDRPAVVAADADASDGDAAAADADVPDGDAPAVSPPLAPQEDPQ
jgi:polyhydroxyalkanoate synthesis regulator phasin